MRKKLLAAAAATTILAAPAHAIAQEGANPVEFDFYGSLRLQGEAVSPDNHDSYNGVRDAYSRFGFIGTAPLAPEVDAFAQLEIPLDLANGKVQDPFNTADEDIRIAKVGLNTEFGTFAYGRDWLPYYNAIAFPVDMFNSYQSGYATYAGFRESDTLFYYSPDINGFSVGAAYTTDGANEDNPFQLTASYAFGDTTLALGLQDANDDADNRDWGLSAMHSFGALSLAAKVEYRESDIDAIDGDTAANIFASYTVDQHTIKAMYANVDGWGGDFVHLGYDFQFSDALLLFAEYYYESEDDDIGSGAIPIEKARDTGDGNIVGDTGDAFIIGMHYSF